MSNPLCLEDDINHTKHSLNGSLFNPLNAELNPICHLLAFLGAHHILHVSRIRVKLLARAWLDKSFASK